MSKEKSLIDDIMIAMLESQLRIKNKLLEVAKSPQHSTSDNHYLIWAEIKEIESQLKELKS